MTLIIVNIARVLFSSTRNRADVAFGQHKNEFYININMYSYFFKIMYT